MILTSTRGVLGSAAVLLLAAGCAGNSASVNPNFAPQPAMRAPTQVPPGYRLLPGPSVSGPILSRQIALPRSPGYIHPHAVSQTLYVADPQNNQVLLYDPTVKNPKSFGKITDGVNGPTGLAVDGKGTLYVVNANNTVTEYLAGQTSPSFTITSGLNGPYGIGVDSHRRVFVANLTGSLVGYKPGKTSPYETLTDVGPNPVGVAVDSSNNVWVADDSNNTIYIVKAGTSVAQNSGLTALTGPIGIAFESADTLFVANFGANTVGVYPAGSTSPTRTISTGLSGPTLDGFARREKFFQSNQNSGAVEGYKKDANMPYSTITGIPQPLGVAAFPRQRI